MIDFLNSLENQSTEQDELTQAIPLVLSESTNENRLIKQELLRQSEDLQEMRIQVAGALYLIQNTIGMDKYLELTTTFNELVANKLKNPTEPSVMVL